MKPVFYTLPSFNEECFSHFECVECGETVKSYWKYCPMCGHELMKEQDETNHEESD